MKELKLKETAAALKLDAAVNTACDLVEPDEWAKILRALAGRAPAKTRSPEARALRLVRDLAKRAGPSWSTWQLMTVEREQLACEQERARC